MTSTDCIEQKGIIDDIENGVAHVLITSVSACASCQANSACHMSETAQKEVDVFIGNSNFHKGEPVKVLMKKSLGLKATFLAYVLPFIILLATLIILTNIGISEAISGIFSLLILIPYFLILYLSRNSLQKTFQFTLNKVS